MGKIIMKVLKFSIYYFFGFFFILLISCGNNNNAEYRIEQITHDDYQTIKLIDKNNTLILQMNVINDGIIIAYDIIDGKNFKSQVNLNEDGTIVSFVMRSSNFNSIVNISDDGIDSYLISDEQRYSNTTYIVKNHNEHILIRAEWIEDIIYDEKIYGNGLIEKEKRENN